ncbi:MAG: hypothetical protein CGW95_14360 [Phenylobacterium zucineum]|nr:MAG: hypothetical protein CGW95_14360 [Phenylobacterium zucineum]
MRGLAAHDYDAAISATLASVKERGQTAVWARLTEAVQVMARALRETWPDAAVLCMPSSKAAMARRGVNPALLLCKRVARAAGLPMIGGLNLVRQPRDQAALGLEGRAANLRDSMRFDPPRGFDREVILFDDVVTTGATLLEARRAVEAAGAGLRVSGFCVLAETLRKSPPSHPNESMFSPQAT